MTSQPATPTDSEAIVLDMTVDYASRCVTIGGELDMATAPVLLDAVDLLLKNADRDVTIDLAELQFVDCSGLTALAQIDLALRSAGCRLIIANPSARQRRLFMLTGLSSMLVTAEPRTAGTIRNRV